MANNFRDLIVWQKAMTLVESVYSVTNRFPRDERFGLTAQIRRAAVSIPCNIAEGNAIGGRTYTRHVKIALGSEAELQTQLDLAVLLGFATERTIAPLLGGAAEIGRMLQGLSKALKQKTRDKKASRRSAVRP